MIQGIEDKIEFGGMAETAFLSASVPPAEIQTAKFALLKLHETRRDVNWHVEIANNAMTIHTDRHPTFCYRAPLSHYGKGMGKLRSIGRELVERIEAGAC